MFLEEVVEDDGKGLQYEFSGGFGVWSAFRASRGTMVVSLIDIMTITITLNYKDPQKVHLVLGNLTIRSLVSVS